MLENLIIKNIVLIDELNISFANGLCILTGETGSGKSILLDALNLAIGGRYNSRLLRNDEEQGSVTATFSIPTEKNVIELLKEQDIDYDDNLILRRVIYKDGRSKAFVNSVPVSQSFLQSLGRELVEIHGQNDQINLLNSVYHRDILDNYGNLQELKLKLSNIFDDFKNVEKRYNYLLNEKENIEKEKDYLKNIIKELEELDLKEGEEDKLNDERILLMNKEKVIDLLNDVSSIINGQNSINKLLGIAQNYLSRSNGLGEDLIEKGKNAFEEINDSFDKASIEFNEGLDKIEIILDNLNYNENTVNEVEERLFKIRNLSRKYNIKSDYINDFLEEVKKKLDNLENQTVEFGDLKIKLNELKKEYIKYSLILREKRKEAARKLSEELVNELIPLKMGKVKFDVEFKELDIENSGKNGMDSIRFVASTNVGTKLDDLSKIASGGELSRFMLALKVVLLKINSVPTLIFDEIDTGVSGQVADAIGERLKKLGEKLQVFVITHLPQVASKGNFHIRVKKEYLDNLTRTIVEVLNEDEREIEIAKMISGSTITNEAVIMARKLLK